MLLRRIFNNFSLQSAENSGLATDFLFVEIVMMRWFFLKTGEFIYNPILFSCSVLLIGLISDFWVFCSFTRRGLEPAEF